MIGGFDTPSRGDIFIGGENVTFEPPYRRSVNQVFQSYALFPHLSIYENISFGLRMKKISGTDIRRRVNRVVEMTSLEDLVHRKPAQLSGGQRQRVALARAIVCEPEALSMSDRVAVMSAGRVEQIGAVDEIYYRPASRFVATFIGETNIVEATALDEREGLLRCRLEGGLELDVKSPTATQGRNVLLSLRPEKIRLHRHPPVGANAFKGRVSAEVFKGAVDDLTLDVPGGLELRALLANDGQQDLDFREGDEVFCQIQPGDINIISA